MPAAFRPLAVADGAVGVSARHEMWECGGCGEVTGVRHWLKRDGVMAHDPDAAFREAAGLDEPELSHVATNWDSA